MKKQNFRFLILYIWFITLFISLNGQNYGKQVFLEEKKSCYKFNNTESSLIIDKQSSLVQLLDNSGKISFAEFQKPAFLVNDNWLTAQPGPSVLKIDEESVIISFPTSNKLTINLLVEKAGESGFKLNYSIQGANITDINGIIALNPVEEIYGFGETWNGEFSQRGEKIRIWDKGGTPDECAWMPYYVSTNNYAFFINYGGLVIFDVGQENVNELKYEFKGNELEYTVLSGNNVASAVTNYVKLTGMPAKPPRWAFKPWFWLMSDPDIPDGHISTLRGYHFLEMIDKLEEMDIPVGVTWLEPPWQTARTTFIPNEEFCQDLKSLLSKINDRGIKTLAWTVPYTSPEASNWNEAVSKNYLVRKPGGKIDQGALNISSSGELEGEFYNRIDYFNPDACQWWQDQIEKSIDLGLSGYKLDAGQGLQTDGILYGDRIGRDVHNSYAREYNRVFFEVLSKKLGEDFLMIPRAAWIGSQSYTNFKWPGDLTGSFASNGLPSSVMSSLSLAMSGLPFVSTDIGGFSNRPARELPWIRWAQFGSMLPGFQTLHMPWWYSDEATQHFKYLAWLHTDLIPYWESLGNLAHDEGIPVIRPLIWDYQEDKNTWRIEDEFTVGEFILVAPFMDPERMRDVYLPEGTWYDFWDNEELQGKKTVRWFKGWNESIYKFPLYIKEGAIIPMEISNSVTGFGSEYSKGYITLSIWPKKGTGTEFTLNDREENVTVKSLWTDEDKMKIEWKNSEMDYIFRIHIKSGLSVKKIKANGVKISEFESLNSFQQSNQNGWYFDSETNKLWIKKEFDDASGNLEIDLKN